ncbi:adaptor protein MecA [Sporosarcina beigongshangi]|uniref:adaptor protein MecA n=1 Tax=Sporosarcina beigongshangi TaxID=2782538 RepID=UPI001939B704|nr:adaptor protein MecA [Sporosarcina beigongshangi]
MEIERINENTVKFFLSYIDIEERGFTREEVWYNRDKSEELFWEMMDEINDESEFEIEGPLWIQVHAMSGGIEVTVTRAQMSDDGEALDSPFGMADPRKMFPHESEIFGEEEEVMPDMSGGTLEWLDNVFVFKEFDDIIPLAERMSSYSVETSLYSYDDHYYLHVAYEDETMDEGRKTDLYSVVSEFGMPSNLTIHRLKEYGKVVMNSDVFTTIQHYFGTK